MFLTSFLPCSTDGAILCWDQCDCFIVMAQTIQTDEMAMLYTSSSSLSHVWGIAHLKRTQMAKIRVCIHTHTHIYCCCCLVAKLCLFATPWLQHARLPCPLLSPGVCSNSWYLDFHWLYIYMCIYMYFYIFTLYI